MAVLCATSFRQDQYLAFNDFIHARTVDGKSMGELILDGEFKALDMFMLDLTRFEEDRLIQEYNVT